MRALVIFFLLAASGICQSTTTATITTVPVNIIINWPNPALVAAKYGPLPKWAVFGEVIGCDMGASNVTYGEGDVIAAIRTSNAAGGYDVFSRLDALQLVANSQSASTKNKVTAILNGLAASIVDAKASGIFGSGSTTGVGVVLGAQAINILLPNLQGALNLKQLIQYTQAGIQTTMTISAGRCSIPMDVLFGTPRVAPATTAAPMRFTLNVPVDR